MKVIEDSSECTIKLEGSVGITNAGELYAAAVKAARTAKPVTVLCQEAERLDTSTIQILLALKQQLTANDIPFEISGMNSAINSYLDMAGLSTILTPDGLG